ncbi:PREDICTED: uncharacterized protein LOC105447970 isoform X2 [Wasmannia auropunctata]|uniref:uncharacterized protein LOC105447970 isoform X2 n=1 Tax=Wasmannia auropunctata TaxID=64793 RepID=UPI0005EF5DF9|nr:PREDICTED: uncharacterized protein LOC105447970 isoform X2 [Wasmannia auropunctata]
MWSKWPSFSQKICTLMKLKDPNDVDIFISLGKLFTPSVVRLENGKRWKPNTQEVNNDLVPSIERMISKAQLMKYKVQPFIAAVGLTSADCQDFYVVIDKNYYHFHDCRTAVDACFKAIHALHANYPPQSEAIWYFL